MNSDNIWAFAILCGLFSGGNLNFPPPPEYTDEDKALDEEYAKAGACERAIKDNRQTLQYGGYPRIKKEGNEVRCRGYIYSMNEEICDDCKKCKIQYGHPFYPYWNQKNDFVEWRDPELHQRIHEMANDVCSYGYKITS